MAKKEWVNWLKCNVLEIVILVLVLVLLVKAFSAPVLVEEISKVPMVEESANTLEAVPAEMPAEEEPVEPSAEKVSNK